MLVKLMRLEFRATFRQYAALYAAILILIAVIAGGILLRSNFVTLMAILFYCMISIVMLTITIIFVIQRYARNLFGVEGHFMHTIPAAPGKLLTAKTLVSLIWLVLPYIVLCGNYVLVYWAGNTLDGDFIRGFNEGFRSVLGENLPAAETFITYLPYLVVTVLIAVLLSIMMFYFAVTVANTMARRHRVLTGFLVFFGVNLIYSGLYFVIYTLVPFTFRVYGSSIIFQAAPVDLMHIITDKGLPVSPLVDLLALLFLIGLTIATHNLLKNRLSQHG